MENLVVSMPFKTGKGTAGLLKENCHEKPLVFQCPLRRARVLRDGGARRRLHEECLVSMPFKTGKGTAGSKKQPEMTTAPLEFQCPLRRARVLRVMGVDGRR